MLGLRPHEALLVSSSKNIDGSNLSWYTWVKACEALELADSAHGPVL